MGYFEVKGMSRLKRQLKRVKCFLKRLRRLLLTVIIWGLPLFLLFFYPPTRLTGERLIDLLSNRKPPPWVEMPKEAKVDIDQTKQFKRQKLALLEAKLSGLGQDALAWTRLKGGSGAGWQKVKQDLAESGNVLLEFWGVSIITYQGETIIVGEGSTPINLKDRVLRWQQPIEAAAAKYRLDPALIAAVIEQESGGDPEALSPAGAVGLMQLMPATARSLGVNPYDPAQNIDGGAHYLQIQLQRFGGLDGALAAYNAGPGTVQSQRWALIPETMNYVQRVPQLMEKYEQIWRQQRQTGTGQR